ncbi:MAG: hypothetical protein ACOYYU_19260 [Chloroflexota bacterium]
MMKSTEQGTHDSVPFGYKSLSFEEPDEGNACPEPVKGFMSGFLTKNVRTGGSGGGVGNRPTDHNWLAFFRKQKA